MSWSLHFKLNATRVRDRDHAPSIIFMDEIDSIGSTRIDSGGGMCACMCLISVSLPFTVRSLCLSVKC